jgi:hypothetical protein
VNELAVLVPVLRRPHRVRPLLDSLAASMTVPYRALFIASPDDREEHAAIREAGADFIVVDGNYAMKINAGVGATDEPYLLFAADDLHFHPGWYEVARACLRGGIAVVGTNDLCNAKTATGELATHPFVARWYQEVGTVDEPGKMLHEGYPHEYVDREFTETAQHRGVFAHAPDSIVEHLHPLAGKAPMDDLYAATRRRMRQGYRVYRQRCHMWGGAPEPVVPRSQRKRGTDGS